MALMAYLSKSDFLKYQVCPSYLWLWKHKREVVPVDEEDAINRRLEQGNEVERFARKLFNEATLVETKGAQAKVDTEKLVASGVNTIFQATVITEDGLLAMADVIRYDHQTESWDLYEVKSTNAVKSEHISDTTFQRVAFEDAGYKIGRVSVIHLNKDYVRNGELEPEKLLKETDITDKVDAVISVIRQQIGDALEIINEPDEPKTCSCRLKPKSGHCPTFKYFNPDIPEYSVFHISRIGNKKLGILVDGDITDIEDVPDDFGLTVVQRNQVEVAKSKQPVIDVTAVRDVLSELEYPLYFLDYETLSTALPLFDGCRPFQQVVFQYSLHVQARPGAELEHYEYLARNSAQTPVQGLLGALQEHLGNEGSVVVWNKSFEAARNREMGVMYPVYADFLEGINNRIFDLMDVFSKQHYVHHQFKGSTSIKAVLPVLVPDVSYKVLDIQNGASASAKWYDALFGGVERQESEHIFEGLLKYCCLDTLAMVKIYDYLQTVE